eukprot:GHUV01000779.1.p2 GENE.GHUV01000779.1~~GHUV01000779.1.p2  ORF type:complete len:144 (+),score=39.31 GHUV01000779.1:584-1015(+)
MSRNSLQQRRLRNLLTLVVGAVPAVAGADAGLRCSAAAAGFSDGILHTPQQQPNPLPLITASPIIRCTNFQDSGRVMYQQQYSQQQSEDGQQQQWRQYESVDLSRALVVGYNWCQWLYRTTTVELLVVGATRMTAGEMLKHLM